MDQLGNYIPHIQQQHEIVLDQQVSYSCIPN
jgi:hypothetical protein